MMRYADKDIGMLKDILQPELKMILLRCDKRTIRTARMAPTAQALKFLIFFYSTRSLLFITFLCFENNGSTNPDGFFKYLFDLMIFDSE